MLELAESTQGVMEIRDSRDEWPLLRRIRSEFHEMPGLCLTVPQASRLWNLDRQLSELALYLLVESGFLTRTGDGRFVATERTTLSVSSRAALTD
jgi:hypothetical protein